MCVCSLFLFIVCLCSLLFITVIIILIIIVIWILFRVSRRGWPAVFCSQYTGTSTYTYTEKKREHSLSFFFLLLLLTKQHEGRTRAFFFPFFLYLPWKIEVTIKRNEEAVFCAVVGPWAVSMDVPAVTALLIILMMGCAPPRPHLRSFFCVCMWLSFSLQRTRSSLSSPYVYLFLHFSIFFFHLPPPLTKRRRFHFVSWFPLVFSTYYYYYYGHFQVCLKGRKPPLRLFFLDLLVSVKKITDNWDTEQC